VEENWEEQHHKNEEVLITNETIQHKETQKTNWEGGRCGFFLFVSLVFFSGEKGESGNK
jgi:hypothetical protein